MGNGTHLELDKCRVTRCLVDHAFSLEFHDRHPPLVIRIEQPFTLTVGGRAHRLSPATPADLGPAIDLFGREVLASRVAETGSLELSFREGAELSVDPDPNYEAWAAADDGGLKVVCLPGGGVAIWRGQTATPPKRR